MKPSSSADRSAWIVGACVTLGVFMFLAAGVSSNGLTDDVEAYAGGAQRAALWWGAALRGLAHGSLRAFDPGAIDAAWSWNHEHPPVAKVLMGGCAALLHDRLHWLGLIDAMRMGTVLAVTVSVAALFAVTWRHFGPVAAISAPLLLVTLPRFLFDARAETLDGTAAATCFLLFASVVSAWSSPRATWLTGLAAGVALATKHNAWVHLAALWLFSALRAVRAVRVDRHRQWRMPDVPLALLVPTFVGPVLLWLFWPWLWHDTSSRLIEYFQFHARHYGILFRYFGTVYDDPAAPWHAPLVMLLLTTPPVTLLFVLAGFARLRPRQETTGRTPLTGDVRALAAVQALAALVAVSLPGVPKYAGVKLFAPVFPFLALLAGDAVQSLADRVARAGWSARRAGLVAVVLAVVPGVGAVVSAGAYPLSYYGSQAGGLRGADRLGMETQYYDLFHAPLAAWMNANLPPRARVAFTPNPGEYVRSSAWWRVDGRLRADLQFVADAETADVVVLTHEPRWPRYPEIRDRWARARVLRRFEHEGVALCDVLVPTRSP